MNNITNINNTNEKIKFALWMYNRYSIHYRNGLILYLIIQFLILYVDYSSLEGKFLNILLMKSFLTFLPIIFTISINKTNTYKNKFVLYNSIATSLPAYASVLVYLHFLEYYNSLASIYFAILIVQILLMGLLIYRWKLAIINSFSVVIFFVIIHLIDYPEYSLFEIHYLPFLIFVVVVTAIIAYYYQEIKEKMFKAEQELIEEKSQINSKNKKLSELNDLKTTVFSIISHDLRSPISGINNLLKITIDDFEQFSKEEIKEHLQVINKSSNNVYNLLENLLFWGKIHNENFILKFEKISILKTIKDVIDLMITQIYEKNIEIIFENKEDIEIETDIFIFTTAIRNLLSNAIKFTPNNGKIKIKFYENQDYYKIEIKDNGIGMDSKLLNSLSQFSQDYVRAGTNMEKGSGLGLMIVRDFLKIINGYLEFQSEPNVGTKAIINISKIDKI